jgi:hypothetical protein
LRAEERRDHEEIRGGTRVNEVGGVAAEIILHLLLKAVSERAGGEPELEDAFDAEAQFLVVVDAAGVGDLGFAGDERLFRVGDLVVLRDELENFFAELRSGGFRRIHDRGAKESFTL